MGSAASTERVRQSMAQFNLTDRPADGSDIKDLDSARQEIIHLRKLARDFQEQLKEELKLKAGGVTKKREAVMDKNEKVIVDTAKYVAKVVPKSDEIRDLLIKVVTTNILFSSYSTTEHAAIVDAFECQTIAADKFVIKQGESGELFYVCETGKLEIYVKTPAGESKVGNPIVDGMSFGELALMYNTPRAASIKAIVDCNLWAIERSTFRGIILYHKYLRNKQYMDFLRDVEIMDKKLGVVMSDSELEKMTVSLEREVYEAGDAIVREGNTGDHFYIIADGEVGVYKADANGKDEKVAVLKQGGYFGEKALLREDVRQASCIAETKVAVLTLGREDFIDMMGTIEDLMNVSRKPTDATPVCTPVSTGKFALSCSLSDLSSKATLGCGAFGRVKLCHHVAKDTYYALKCQAKTAIVESGLQEHVLNEMKIMRSIEHPFIARLYLALQDDKYIYFVLELLQGGELFTYLRNKGKLSEQSARFYSAIVVHAFATLHSKKVAYRDLKPENLVMDSKGYVKLVDFGLAKQLVVGKTWTLCGTPDYLAPEIILNEGHDFAVDYWALGVLIFEMVVGQPPFYAEDPMEVYEKILTGNPVMPSFFTRNLSDLVKKLLRSQQSKRLGNTRGGTSAVIKHKWFSSFDWTSLENRDMKPPYEPTVKSIDDISNFDTFDEGVIPSVSTWSPDLAE